MSGLGDSTAVTQDGGPVAVSSDRDRTTVRRARRAGITVAGIVATLGAAVTITTGFPGGAVVATVALALGAFVAASWLLLAALLDILAGDPPGGRRWAWTVGVTLLAMLGPFFVVAALSQVATLRPAP